MSSVLIEWDQNKIEADTYFNSSSREVDLLAVMLVVTVN